MLFSVVVPTPAQAQTTPGFCYTFTQNLGEGRPLSSANAQALTTALSSAGFWNAATPITAYDDAVASAVSGFQEKYASQILTPNGLSYGTGYVGVSTRAELNTLYGCSTPAQTTQSFQCPAGYVCTPVNPNPAPACPAGWTCMPTTTVTTPVIPATNPAQSSISLSPAAGPAGSVVTIMGSGFNAYAQLIILNATAGGGGTLYPTFISSSELTFVVPNLSPGTYEIEVNGSASESSYFTITQSQSNVGNGTAALSLDPSSPPAGQTTQTSAVPVLVFDLLSQSRTASLSAVSVQLNSSGGSISNAYLYQGSTQVASAVEQNGIAQFSNISTSALSASTLYPFTVKVDASNISSSMTVSASVAGTGISLLGQSGNAIGVSGNANGSTITITNGSAASASNYLGLATDASSPLTGSVVVTNKTSGQYSGLPVLVFDVINKTSFTPTLSSITAQISETGVGSVSNAYLYSAGNLVGSAVIQNGMAQFPNIQYSNMTIPVDVILPFTIKVDVNGVTSGSETVSASISPSGVSSVQNLPVNGSASGNPITVTNQ